MTLYNNIKNVIRPKDSYNLIGNPAEVSKFGEDYNLPEVSGTKIFHLAGRKSARVADFSPVIITPYKGELFLNNKGEVVTVAPVRKKATEVPFDDMYIVLRGLPELIASFKEGSSVAAYLVKSTRDITNSLSDVVLSGDSSADPKTFKLDDMEREGYHKQLMTRFFTRSQNVIALKSDERLVEQIIEKYFSK